MKNRLLMFAMAALAAVGMISCGNPAEPENVELTLDNANDYIVTLGNYEGLTVEAEKEETTDEMLDYYTSYFFSYEAADIEGWEAKEGDTVNIDYVGKIDGIAFSGGTASGEDLVLGSDSYISGFEDGLIGVKAGDTRELELTFPENYAKEDYAGKACTFSVTVNSVTPAFTDEAVAALGNDLYSTAAEYRSFVEKAVEEYAEEDYDDTIVSGVLDQVIETSEFTEIPDSILEVYRTQITDDLSDTATSYGIDVETYLTYCGTTLDELATRYAKQQIIFYRICKDQSLEPSEDDIEQNAENFAEYYGYDSTDAYFAENSKDEFITTLIGNNVYNYLLSVTNVVAPAEE